MSSTIKKPPTIVTPPGGHPTPLAVGEPALLGSETRPCDEGPRPRRRLRRRLRGRGGFAGTAAEPRLAGRTGFEFDERPRAAARPDSSVYPD